MEAVARSGRRLVVYPAQMPLGHGKVIGGKKELQGLQEFRSCRMGAGLRGLLLMSFSGCSGEDGLRRGESLVYESTQAIRQRD
jgi:hypothetical protein